MAENVVSPETCRLDRYSAATPGNSDRQSRPGRTRTENCMATRGAAGLRSRAAERGATRPQFPHRVGLGDTALMLSAREDVRMGSCRRAARASGLEEARRKQDLFSCYGGMTGRPGTRLQLARPKETNVSDAANRSLARSAQATTGSAWQRQRTLAKTVCLTQRRKTAACRHWKTRRR